MTTSPSLMREQSGMNPMSRLPVHGAAPRRERLLSVLRNEWRVRVCGYVTVLALLAEAHATLRRKEVQRQSQKVLQIGTFWRACKAVGVVLLDWKGGDRGVRGR